MNQVPVNSRVKGWIGASVFLLGFSYWWITAQVPLDNSMSNYDIQLLDHWNRNASYDTILLYLEPRYERWRKENPVKMAETVKYYYNSLQYFGRENLMDTLQEIEDLIRNAYGGSIAIAYLEIYRAYHQLETGAWEEAKARVEAVANNKQLLSVYPRLYSDANSLAGFIVYQFGEQSKAMRYNEIADSVMVAHFGKDFFGRLVALNNFSIFYEAAGNHEKGLEIGLQLIQLIEKYYVPHHENHLKALNTLGLKYHRLGRFQEAINTYEKSIQLNLENKLDINLFNLYINISSTYTALYDYDQAENYLQLAEENLRKREGNFKFYELELILRRSSMSMDMGDSIRREFYIQKLQTFMSENFNKYDYMLLNANAVLHLYHREKGDYDVAEFFLDKYRYLLEVYIGEESTEWANFLGYKGELNHLRGALDTAMYYHQEALALYESIHGPKHNYALEVRLSTVKTLIELGRYQEADDQLNFILSLDQSFSSPFNLPSYEKLYKHIHLISTLQQKIKLIGYLEPLQKEVQYKTKEVYYDYLAQEFDRVLYEQGGQRMDDGIFKSSEKSFKESIVNCYELYRITGDAYWAERAFEYGERTKSLKIQSILRSKMASVNGGLPDSLRLKEQELAFRANALRKQISDLTSEDSITRQNLQYQLASIEVSYKKLIKKLEIEFPRYFQIRYQSKPATVYQVRKMLLQKDRQLIQCHLIDSVHYAIRIGKKEIEFKQMDLPSDIKSNAFEYYEAMKKRDRQAHDSLSQWFFEHFYKDLFNGIKVGAEVMIVPDGWMYYINPESIALPDRLGKFLIHQYNIYTCYSPTVSIESAQFFNGSKAAKDWVGFVPGFDHEVKINEQITFSSQPWMKKVSPEIAKLYKSKLFSGNEARRDSFQLYGNNGKILHLGTHAVANDSDPLSSYFLLGVDNEPEPIKALEIFNLSLSNKMTVLTACETGVGQLKSGEGMVSLARAFAYAGSPNLLLTMWSVDEEQTAKLIKSFYQAVSEGTHFQKAIQQAKLEFLDQAKGELRHPFYWAGIVYYGSSTRLNDPFWTQSVVWIAGICILMCLLIFLIYYTKRKKLHTLS
jgi:CHAT domain-containing protein